MNIRTKKSFLIEAALSKGSQKVINDSNLVAGLADAMRDDARSNPSSFPAGSSKTFQKAPDEDLANWFLENIDKIEREGYEGTVYSRDGLNNDWIVRRYIAGSHNWEDLTGVMNMNLRDWYLLKNRNLLDANHKDLPKFKSVRDVGYYMTTHYKKALDDARDAAKNAARNKMAKSVKLVDNEDYRIYTTLNRAAGCALGLGTQWCTANSNYPGHYHSYSSRAMLFQMFPYKKVKDADGKTTTETTEDGKKVINDTTKYQFDAGGPNFMDITDRPAAPAFIAETYPYLYTDLSTALKQNKDKMEQAFKELAGDPTLQADDFKIKTYEIDDEIEKLHKFVERGYFTDKVRSKAKADQEKHAETPDAPKQVTQSPPQGEPQMEKVDKDVAAMLKSLKKYDQLVESVAPVLGMKTLSGQKMEENIFRNPNLPADKQLSDPPEEIEMDVNEGIRLVQQTVDADENTVKEYKCNFIAAGATVTGITVIEEYEEDDYTHILVYVDYTNKQVRDVYENDEFAKQVSAALGYTVEFTEAGMQEQGKASMEAYADPQMDIDEGDMEEGNEFSGELAKAKSQHQDEFTVDGKTYPVTEQADQDVLAWMNRFAKLGNMKGYGR